MFTRISKARNILGLGVMALQLACAWAIVPPQPVRSGEELALSNAQSGKYGGRIAIALRSEPKTFNPVTLVDGSSREVTGRLHADLIHINRATQNTEPALAKSWKVSKDGLRYTLQLRRGVRFSDGAPFDADDVVFSFQVYLDEKLHSPQRDLLVVGDKPITVTKIDAYTVAFQLAQPYAAAERIFDNVAILPRHLLSKTYEQGKIGEAWSISAIASEMAGLGPFRLKEYVPGQRATIERNPYYWKMDKEKRRLPYLDEITFLFVPSEDAQVIRFQSGETDVISRMSADNYSVLERDQQSRAFHLNDLGPGLEYNFLFFNLNSVLPKNAGTVAAKQDWFRKTEFRRAISAAIDRDSITKLVYRGRATSLVTHVTPANKLWLNSNVRLTPRSTEKAREMLRTAGFSWKPDGTLVSASGVPVEFSILTSSSNAQRTQIATIIQDDLKQIGIKAQVVPLEFRALLDRVFQSHDYEAAVLGLGGGDVDPNPQMNVWLSTGSNHLWDLGESKPATPWESEIDGLMKQQISTLKVPARKRLYNRVQQLVAENLPIICLASPNILVGAKNKVGNFNPSILDPYVLWNADELFLR
jgi:peptide/nickel transport system substrate-binding protein